MIARTPLIGDNPSGFEPSLVPSTYLNTLMLGQWYTIPIFNIDSDKNITIFDGWWFGKRLGLPYGPDPLIDNKNAKLKLILKGNELSWTQELTVENIIEKAK